MLSVGLADGFHLTLFKDYFHIFTDHSGDPVFVVNLDETPKDDPFAPEIP